MQEGIDSDKSTIGRAALNSLDDTSFVIPSVKKAKSFAKCNFSYYIEGIKLQPLTQVNCLVRLGKLAEALGDKRRTLINERLIAYKRAHGIG